MRSPIIFEQAKFTLIERKMEFGGREYAPDRAKAYFDATLCHTLPLRNLNGRGFSAATLANSFTSARNQLMDFDHRLAFYASDTQKTEDRVCGGIVDVEFPDKKQAVASMEKGTPVPFRALLVAYRKAKGVEKMIEDIAEEVANWRTSIEVEYDIRNAALFYDGKFIPVSKASEAMLACVKPNGCDDFEGKTLTYCPGGEDGELLITGAAFTKWPADPKTALAQMAACATPKKVILLNTGWKSKDDYAQAVATKIGADGLPAPAQVKAGMVCGQTMPAGSDNHTHDILQDLSVVGGDHSHYARIVSVDQSQGGGCMIEGVTSPKYAYDSNGNYAGEHSHMFRLGGMGRSDMVAVVKVVEGENMDKQHVKFLRDLATASKDPEQGKLIAAEADRLEKALGESDISKVVEETIATRIKNGDLIPKAQHETAVANATKTGEDKVRQEIAAKEQAEKDRQTALANRMKQLTDAKINVKFALTPEKTIEQAVASIPAGKEGDEKFAERFAEWQHIAKTTGQMVATAAPAEPAPVPVAPATSAPAAGKRNMIGLV